MRILQASLLIASFFPVANLWAQDSGQPAVSPSAATATASAVEKPPLTPAQQLEQQNKKYQALESLSNVLNILETRYVDEKLATSDVLIEKALKGLVSSLDPHTLYLPPSDLKDFQSDTSGKFGGVGIVLSQTSKFLEIVEVMPDSPAARAGIQPGDILYSIEDEPLTIKNAQELVNRIRGLAGTNFTLEVVPADVVSSEKLNEGKLGYPLTDRKLKTRKYKLQREVIRTVAMSSQRLADGYAYVRLDIFQEDTSETLDKALTQFEDQMGGKLRGLVLDLRDNPGGLFDQAVRVADLFLDSGIIVSTIGREKTSQSVEYASKRNTHPYMPIVVLVNEKSASASEIVAGALQDHARAVIMGTTSFGKGSVQQIILLPNGGGLKLTIARYYTPKGRSIQAKGIVPDIVVSATKQAEKKEAKSRKEADLEGHIEASDLSKDALSVAEAEKWPLRLRQDILVQSAFSYLKNWEKFKK
jgi:carboxyl-terminal processing protease